MVPPIAVLHRLVAMTVRFDFVTCGPLCYCNHTYLSWPCMCFICVCNVSGLTHAFITSPAKFWALEVHFNSCHEMVHGWFFLLFISTGSQSHSARNFYNSTITGLLLRPNCNCNFIWTKQVTVKASVHYWPIFESFKNQTFKINTHLITCLF